MATTETLFARWAVGALFVLVGMLSSGTVRGAAESGFVVINPYQGGNPYKGQLHTHCQAGNGDCVDSDDAAADIGSASSAMALYRSKGFDFVSITSHGDISIPLNVPSGMIHIPGVEEYTTVNHMNAWDLSASSGPLRAVQDVIAWNSAHGGVSSFSHPNNPAPSEWTSAAMIRLPADFVEVWGYNGNCEQKWNEALSAGRHIFGIGVDDAHTAASQNWGWVIVYAPSLTRANIMASLRAGNFTWHGGNSRAGAAPDLHVSYNDQTRTIGVSSSSTGQFTWWKSGGIIRASALDVSSDRYTITGDEGFVRVTFKKSGSGGRYDQNYAGSQPFWIIRNTGSGRPAAMQGGVVNGASFLPGISAASWVTIRGSDLSRTTRAWQPSDFLGGALPAALDGVGVKINGRSAFVSYISPTQINALAPDDDTVGPVQVEVTAPQGTTDPVTVYKTRVGPAFFCLFGPGQPSYVAAVYADGTVVGKPGLLPGVVLRPAKPGDLVQLFGTGFGATIPAGNASQLVSAPDALAGNVAVWIGGKPAEVGFAGLVASGLYQLNVTVPDLPEGDAPVLARIDDVTTQAGVYLTIQR